MNYFTNLINNNISNHDDIILGAQSWDINFEIANSSFIELISFCLADIVIYYNVLALRRGVSLIW